MYDINWTELGKEVGIGAVLGFAVGFAAKKAMKMVLILVALIILILVALETQNIITIHWDYAESAFQKAAEPEKFLEIVSNFFQKIARYIPGSGSFILGCWLGFRKG
ncbi:MAG TPA: hypothetical protein GXX29_03925 [Firmicutes bacterium]|nr:hypothetical protein [Bacillota bacterium]